MKYQELVVNGCSYMHAYAGGQGHIDLAEQLGIPKASSLAISGSANNRILRTTVKHSYITAHPTFYVLGMTFLSRDELPILNSTNEFEGAWTNPQNQDFANLWIPTWQQQDTERYVELKLKWEWLSILDRMEDLQFRMISVMRDLQSRGHAVLIYNQADDLAQDFYGHHRLYLLNSCVNIVDGYQWRAIDWQHSQGVPSMDYGANPVHVVPENMKHRASGFHQALNRYLTDYITVKNLLQ
jgi:hypothetical protein